MFRSAQFHNALMYTRWPSTFVPSAVQIFVVFLVLQEENIHIVASIADYSNLHSFLTCAVVKYITNVSLKLHTGNNSSVTKGT